MEQSKESRVMNQKLALLGGPATILKPFVPYQAIGREEIEAAREVLESKVLSKFIGAWDPDFYGGPKIKEFERAWERHFNVKSAVTVNSNTSGMIAAMGAIGIEPGDEVIVSPWTMSATATAILIWNAIPVFADIERDTFNLDPKSIEKCITSRTRAILVTSIFGHSADMESIMAIAKKHNLLVVEDAAQIPGAKYHGKYAGTLSDIGVYSLNYHKHIHTGEGGVCVTNNAEFAERLQLIRNHAECVVKDKPTQRFDNLLGFNFRMGEIEAAIGVEQLKKLDGFAKQRNEMGVKLNKGLMGLKGLKVPTVQKDCTHVYYVYGLTLDTKLIGVTREKLLSAIHAEGLKNISGGYSNIHLLPLYQKKIAYGTKGFPWVSQFYSGHVNYQKGICPVAEELHDSTFVDLYTCGHHYTEEEIELTIRVFQKVWTNLDQLKNQ